MLYWLLYPLGDTFIGFNVFRYLTFRTGLAIATAFFISLVAGPWMIVRSCAPCRCASRSARKGPEHHQVKAGTPTMGGILIVSSFVLTTLLWADLENPYIWTVLLVTLGFAAIGLIDDLLKVRRQRNLGLTVRQKLFLQMLVGLAAGSDGPRRGDCRRRTPARSRCRSSRTSCCRWGSSTCRSWSSSSSARRTPSISPTASMVWRSVRSPSPPPPTRSSSTLPVTCGSPSTCASSRFPVPARWRSSPAPWSARRSGFLWFNCHPAQVFMGDVGSLALGGGIGIVAVVAKQELLLVLVGGLFVLEELSVIIQVLSYKLRGKRVFRMAPLHHHFELLGWTETQVVVRFWIIAVVFALAGLSTLKLR